jgi:DNA mismatch repair ATPase MutS
MNNQEFKCSISENLSNIDIAQSCDTGETLTLPKVSDTFDNNLNKCLRKGIVRSNPLTGMQEMKQIRSKTKEEINFLEIMFEKDPTWNRKTVQLCKKHLKLETHQIYKWGYDKKIQLKKNQGKLKKSQRSNGDKTDSINLNSVNETTPADLNEFVSDLIEYFENSQNIPQFPILNSSEQPLEKSWPNISEVTKQINCGNLHVNFANSMENQESEYSSDLYGASSSEMFTQNIYLE